MSNLGWYQVATTMFKKFGGPLKFFDLYGAGCAAIGGVGALGISAGVKKIAEMREEKDKAAEAAITHIVTQEGKSNEGLEFTIGDTFRVLERDGDATLIEIIGDENNPYFVSTKFLSDISDYKPT